MSPRRTSSGSSVSTHGVTLNRAFVGALSPSSPVTTSFPLDELALDVAPNLRRAQHRESAEVRVAHERARCRGEAGAVDRDRRADRAGRGGERRDPRRGRSGGPSGDEQPDGHSRHGGTGRTHAHPHQSPSSLPRRAARGRTRHVVHSTVEPTAQGRRGTVFPDTDQAGIRLRQTLEPECYPASDHISPVSGNGRAAPISCERGQMLPSDVHEQERTLEREVADASSTRLPGVEVLARRARLAGALLRLRRPPAGVDHALCERVTDALRDYLDRYTVDVSSPGIERPLRKPAHFAAAVGRTVALRTAQPSRRPQALPRRGRRRRRRRRDRRDRTAQRPSTSRTTRSCGAT